MSGSPLWLLQDDEDGRAKHYYWRCNVCAKEFKATKTEVRDEGCAHCGEQDVQRESPVEGRGTRAAKP